MTQSTVCETDVNERIIFRDVKSHRSDAKNVRNMMDCYTLSKWTVAIVRTSYLRSDESLTPFGHFYHMLNAWVWWKHAPKLLGPITPVKIEPTTTLVELSIVRLTRRSGGPGRATTNGELLPQWLVGFGFKYLILKWQMFRLLDHGRCIIQLCLLYRRQFQFWFARRYFSGSFLLPPELVLPIWLSNIRQS